MVHYHFYSLCGQNYSLDCYQVLKLTTQLEIFIEKCSRHVKHSSPKPLNIVLKDFFPC